MDLHPESLAGDFRRVVRSGRAIFIGRGALFNASVFRRFPAKTGSANHDRYVRAYQTEFVWELEALDPKVLQKLLTAAIDGVIDRRAFNAELAQERTDAAHNAVVREIILRTLREEVTTER